MRGRQSAPRYCGLNACWLAFVDELAELSGCANVVETRTIRAVQQALESGDLQQLKKATSPDFEERVIAAERCVDDLKLLRLPTGDLESTKLKKSRRPEARHRDGR